MILTRPYFTRALLRFKNRSSSAFLDTNGGGWKKSIRTVQSSSFTTSGTENIQMKVEVLTAKHGEQAAQVIIDAFKNDPYNWGRALNRPSDFFDEWMKNVYLPSVVASPVRSLVAVDDDGETVIGVLILEEFKDQDAPDPSRMAVYSIMGKGHDIFYEQLLKLKGEDHDSVGPVCYFAWLAVSPHHRRRHIGEALVKEGQVLAKAADYRFALAFCTSPKSSFLFQKQGFERWGEVNYGNFQLKTDGSFPFKSLPDEMTVMVTELK